MVIRIYFIIRHILFTALVLLIYGFSVQISSGFSDNFYNLKAWKPIKLAGNKPLSVYSIVPDSTESYLKMESRRSASGLVFDAVFDPNVFPVLEWRWRVEKIIPEADASEKQGDDYALRIFVMFEDDSASLSIWESIERTAIRLFSGYDPPHRSLNFVWANQNIRESFYESPYSETVAIIPIRSGMSETGIWLAESVYINEWYQRIFKGRMPKKARIAIMCDSDNTGKSTEAYLDYIRVSGE